MAFSLSDYGWEAPVCPVCPSFNPDGSIDPALTDGTILLINANDHAYGSSMIINQVTGKIISTATPMESEYASSICNNALWDGGPGTYLNNAGITSFGKKVLRVTYGVPAYLNSFDNFKPAAGESFTIDFRFGCVTNTGLGTWAFERAQAGSLGFGWLRISGAYIPGGGYHTLACTIGGTAMTITTGYLLTNRMHHIAITRDSSGVIRLFADGVLAGSITNAGALTDSINANNTSRFRMTSSDGYGVSFSEIRFIRGSAAWTANFTPPTASYT